MLSDLLRWGGRRPDVLGDGTDVGPPVPSKGFPKFLTALSQQPSPLLLDFGPVIGANVEFFGERLGCKLFIEDLVADIDRHARAGTPDALPATFDTRFRHADASVDGILCWDIFDYLDRPAASALARQIVRMLRPGGAVMGFFCSTATPHAPFTKYEIIDGGSLRHRHHPGIGGAKRVLQNRDIIRMFDGLVVAESFLLKSNTREMLLRRR
ncbi:MAG TPA: class I SAM-dependent methyltransferase [Vicinamibacterales bacterium]|nr:class I SAM-dependent methyltransferase [Vicinamibacterales bacterium]